MLDIVLSTEQIHARVAELAAEIRRDHPDDLHVVAVLSGAFVFLADLVRQIPGDLTLDFIAVASYGSARTSSGEVRLLKDLDAAIEGRRVVIVEDIIETSATLAYLKEALRARNPRSLKVACLLEKRREGARGVTVDYVGFTIPDRFVVGYGLDYAQKYRNLPYIAAL